MKFFFNTLIFLLLSLVAVAQDNCQVSSYSVDDGLPQSSIWNITQDRNGFLWVSTSDGLCRFDGYNFTVYKNNPKDSSSICGNRDHRFYVDKTGNLWIVCWNGISLYSALKDNFTTIFTYQPALPIDNLNTFFGEDEQYIWAGLANCGLIKIDKRTYKVFQIKTADDDLSAVKAWASGFVENGRIWICTLTDFFIYDIGKNKILKTAGDRQFSSIADLNDSEAVAGGDKYLALINKKKLTFTYLPVNLNNNSSEIIADILPESNDEVILACHKGVFYYNVRSETVTKSIISFDIRQKNKYAFARCLYRDRSGNLWIGTNGDGLKKINYPYKKFLSYCSHSETSNLVKSIYADSQGVYVGYFNNGMDIFNRKNGFEKHVSFLWQGYDNSNCVYAIAHLDADLFILNLAAQNKICVYSASSGAMKMISPLLKKIMSDPEHATTMYPFFLKEINGTILTVIGECLVSLNEPHSNEIKPAIVHRFPEETLCCCFQDTKGVLWVGTMNCIYYTDGSQWNKVSLPENVQVKSINNDNNGNLWAGTVKGLYILDSNKKITNYFSETNGLSNQFIYGVLRDDDGNMWFSHNKGLSVYNIKTKEFRHYYKEDGLQSSEFNTNSYFKTKDGMLFFGGINGINAFNPREILDNPHIPEVKITSIKVFDEPLKTASAYWNVRSLTLPYTKNSLSFEFAALEYTNSRKNQYAYMMDGLDNSWINVGDKRFARYAALPPGLYTFKVKASNNDGKWQDVPTTIFITIVPPFWQKLWFRILSGLFFIGCIVCIILWIQKQRNKRQIRAMELQRKIQLERERISRDLHDTVGTQLSLISNNIEWVAHPLKVISENEKAEKLQFVNETARDIIATLRETIWALNKQQIPLEEFSDKLKSFVQKQLAIYPLIKLNFTEEIDISVILGPSEALNLFRICQEGIANSLKYANATNIEITINSINGKYKVSIADNGKGFDTDSIDPSIQNGMENMKFRAKDIGSVLEIETTENKGTKITITKK